MSGHCFSSRFHFFASRTGLPGSWIDGRHWSFALSHLRVSVCLLVCTETFRRIPLGVRSCGCRLHSCYPYRVLYSPLYERDPRASWDWRSSQWTCLCTHSLEGQQRGRQICRVPRKIVGDKTLHVSAAYWTALLSLLDTRWWWRLSWPVKVGRVRVVLLCSCLGKTDVILSFGFVCLRLALPLWMC